MFCHVRNLVLPGNCHENLPKHDFFKDKFIAVVCHAQILELPCNYHVKCAPLGGGWRNLVVDFCAKWVN